MIEQQIPESVWWGLNTYAHQRDRAVALADELIRIDSEITDAEQKAAEAAREASGAAQKAISAGQYVQTLREVHAAKGREHKAVHDDAERVLFMVGQACERDGIPMPQPPVDPPLTTTSAFPAQQIPAPGLTPCHDGRCEACTGDRCGHDCHARQAARTIEDTPSGMNPIGHVVAGHTATDTRPQEVEPPNGIFHPENGRE